MEIFEEYIERTFYIALLHETLKRGLTINPDDFLVNGLPTVESEVAFNKAKEAIGKDFIYIFGPGNNQVRGAKINPRITVELKAYYPGSLGLEKYNLAKEDEIYLQLENGYETKTTQIDIHLVANTQKQLRLLHSIMYKALPYRGYIKPYTNDYEEWKSSSMGSYGNLYIEVGNYYDHENLEHGMLEKVYVYECKDGLLYEELTGEKFVPIKDISVLLDPKDSDSLELNIPKM